MSFCYNTRAGGGDAARRRGTGTGPGAASGSDIDSSMARASAPVGGERYVNLTMAFSSFRHPERVAGEQPAHRH